MHLPSGEGGSLSQAGAHLPLGEGSNSVASQAGALLPPEEGSRQAGALLPPGEGSNLAPSPASQAGTQLPLLGKTLS